MLLTSASRKGFGIWPHRVIGPLLIVGLCLGACTREPADQPSLTRRQHEGRWLDLKGFQVPQLGDPVKDNFSAQITYVNIAEGGHIGTVNERAPRPALSLIKLYIAQYIFERGDTSDFPRARSMVRTSDDDLATDLYEKYPQSIDWVIKKYGLESTQANTQWGYSLTSTFDVAYFLAQVLINNPQAPVLRAMRDTAATAKDGTSQNFGTAIFPGVEGTKFAWSNEKDIHASASFGTDFVVVASSYGDADKLTKLVRMQLIDAPLATSTSSTAAQFEEPD
ncbi:hypothetical protein N7326_04270 [Corynebacterium sp. ES2794-CONJ1]|uniref:hypothetical protein n=1 Tax=unclassified Corynebacterium TaxID=2624378 RepID=UPI0021674A7B|nr:MULTISPECIES: hypothetical protein [unclassified Corynebacterium]MCS4490049.1 hypothetical protein [Corynebacterium sp. ES2775-CONJ]MCS4491589.1 hypothetical protein [Corynebacterium sp. ES2715-CONJ3]MCS4531693.1 hypothetical protein [Corynebacterium sp. ES2730-CONJ]MCU9519089.1 hypothetical protein [Corynebacterium sp. ES2794-CONJ1]